MNQVRENIKQLLESITAFIKFGSLSGLLCLIVYCIQIGYIPHDLTLGDSIYLLMLAISFSIIYLILLLCWTSFGIKFSFIWKVFINLIRNITKYKIPDLKFAKLSWYFWFPAISTIIIPFLFTGLERYIVIALNILSSLFCSVLWTAIDSDIAELNNKQKQGETQLGIQEKDVDHQSLKVFPKNLLLIYLILLFYPLGAGFFLGFSDELLSQAFTMIGSRKNNQTIYIQSPYKEIVMETEGILYEKSSLFPENTIKVNHADILLSNIGNTMVVNLKKKEDQYARFEIPKNHIFLGEQQ